MPLEYPSANSWVSFVRYCEIEIDPQKIKAILDIMAPHHLWELQLLLGHLAYIRWFISNLTSRIQLFSKLIKKVATSFETNPAKKPLIVLSSIS